MTRRNIEEAILSYLAERAENGLAPASAGEITLHLEASRPTVNRYLASMVAEGNVIREGSGRAIRYRRPAIHQGAGNATLEIMSSAQAHVSPEWSVQAQALRKKLKMPMAARSPISYQREFVDRYVPNQSSLLPIDVADSLLAMGRAQGQQPAGTYARKVLEQLLIDLSWHSSRLEGNRKSLLDTQELFAKGRSSSDDLDSAMLLNHKDAIEFIIDAVPEYGITDTVVRNIQGLLMQGLLEDADAIGTIRKKVVHITDSVYLPLQMPSLLEEMLKQILEKSRNIRNPVEAAFFLWVNIAYLQPFEDGNKRTSRLCANLPLLLTNCAPLSFLDVAPGEYALAMLGIYELLDVTLAVELFAWTYRRSIRKYNVIRDSMGMPDPFRAKYREHLAEAIRQVVVHRTPLIETVAALGLPDTDQLHFQKLLREELQRLESFNCARYRVHIQKAEEWIRDGRPIH